MVELVFHAWHRTKKALVAIKISRYIQHTFDEYTLIKQSKIKSINAMLKKTLLRWAGIGVLIIALFSFNISEPMSKSNITTVFLLGLGTLLLFTHRYLDKLTIKNKNRVLTLLIIFLILFMIANAIMAFLNSSSMPYLGWIIVSLCFISFYFLIFKENNRNVKNES